MEIRQPGGCLLKGTRRRSHGNGLDRDDGQIRGSVDQRGLNHHRRFNHRRCNPCPRDLLQDANASYGQSVVEWRAAPRRAYMLAAAAWHGEAAALDLVGEAHRIASVVRRVGVVGVPHWSAVHVETRW